MEFILNILLPSRAEAQPAVTSAPNVRALGPPIQAPETPTLNVACPSSATIHVQNSETILDNAEIT
jgi:hypothetical protein